MGRFSRYLFLVALGVVLLGGGYLHSKEFVINDKIISTTGDDAEEVEIYNNPGWVTDTLREEGLWTGNDDLDGLSKKKPLAEAAMAAVEQWRFEPYIENGVAVEKRSAVRLAFNLE